MIRICRKKCYKPTALLLALLLLLTTLPPLTLPSFKAAAANSVGYSNPYITRTLSGVARGEDTDTADAPGNTLAQLDDFYRLARYSQSNTLTGTYTISFAGDIDLTTPSDVYGDFCGIGNEQHPFSGTIESIYQDDVQSTINLPQGRALFNCLSSTASVSKLNIISDSSPAVLASCYQLDGGIQGALTTITLSGSVANGFSGESAAMLFGSVKSTTTDDYTLDLSSVQISAAAISAASGSAGVLIGEMSSGSLTLLGNRQFSGFTVTATGGDAGMVAGRICSGAKLTVDDITVIGDGAAEGVRAQRYISGSTDAGGNAGALCGIVEAGGEFSCGTATVTNQIIGGGTAAGGVVGSTLGERGCTAAAMAIDGTTLQGGVSVGGYIGAVTDPAATLSISATDAVRVTLIPTNDTSFGFAAAGGLIGALTLTAANTHTIDLTAAANEAVCARLSDISGSGADVSAARTNVAFGGLVGNYSAAALDKTLTISGGESIRSVVASAYNGSGSSGIYCYGGMLGRLAGNSYCRIEGIGSATGSDSDFTADSSDIFVTRFGGVTAEVGDGAVLDIADISVGGGWCVRARTNVDTYAGGIVGHCGDGAAVRFSKATVIAATALGSSSSSHASYSGQLVGYQLSSLIYAQDDWALTRGAECRQDDIGNYGEVIRNRGDIITLNADHTITLATIAGASGSAVTLGSAADYTLLAITLNSRGYFSAVSGIEGNGYKQLLSAAITISADINLTGYGVTCLIRSDTSTDRFSGTLDGGGNTVTLSIGEQYAVTNAVGNGEIFGHRFLGIFSTTSNATISNLTIDGAITCGQFWSAYTTNNRTMYAGGVTGFAAGTLTLNGVTSRVNITEKNATESWISTNYYGGMVGRLEGSALTAVDCVAAPIISITNNHVRSETRTGGMVGDITAATGGSLRFTNTTLGGSITTAGSTLEQLMVGGLCGTISSGTVNPDELSIDIDGIRSTQSISGAASIAFGGLLGYSWQNVVTTLHNTSGSNVFDGSLTSSGNANYGGLLYEATGKLTVANTTLGGSFSGSHSGSAVSDGLLVCQGKNLYAVVDLTSFTLNSPSITALSGAYCDELVGNNILEASDGYDNQFGGVLSIQTGGEIGSTATQWQRSVGTLNRNARYYYNVQGLDRDNGGEYRTRVAAGEISCAADLLLWHIINYSSRTETEKAAYFFCIDTAMPTAYSVTADIDMSGGISLYPTSRASATLFDFGSHTLTFGNAAVNAPGLYDTAVVNSQHYLMQTGLFYVVSQNLTIRNAVLAGDIGRWSGGSGALITGQISGSHSATIYNEKLLTVDNITLEGLRINGYSSGYAPLLMNKIVTCVTASISNITQGSYTEGGKAAGTLIGDVGFTDAENNDNGTHLKLNFSQMVLDGSAESIFSNATLLNRFQYVADGSSSGIYNFNEAEDWVSADEHPRLVTYGKELEANETEYYDTLYKVRPDVYQSTEVYPYSANGYLPYVAEIAPAQNKYELSVNLKGGDLTEGCGTYEDPYIIRTADQLVSVFNYINDGSPEGWTVNYHSNNTTNGGSSVCSDDHGSYVGSSDGTFSSDGVVNSELNRAWFAHAYYSIANSIEIPSSSQYVGLGTSTTPFAGVIIGNDNTVTLREITGEVSEFGFIKVANGCVIKDLVVSFGSNYTVSATDDAYFGGVIGDVIGGDNIIDNVELRTEGYTLTAKQRRSYVGGYIGIARAGGVVFRNMDGATHPGVSVLIDNSGDNDSFFYANPYIGRVLDTYAVAVSPTDNTSGAALPTMLDNTDKNYTIPTLGSGESRYVSVSRTVSGTVNIFDVTISGAEGLLVLSAALNSGSTAGGNTVAAYRGTARVRNALYTGVGSANGADFTTACADNKTIDSSTRSFIVNRYIDGDDARQLSVSSAENRIVLTADCDMNEYKNGFRGVGGKYRTNANYVSSYYNTDRNALLVSSIDGGGHKITASLALSQYSTNSGNYTAETYAISDLGLFSGKLKAKTGASDTTPTISNLTISGSISVRAYNTSNGNENKYNHNSQYVGGLFGTLQIQGSNMQPEITSVSVSELQLHSQGMVGGLFGYVSNAPITLSSCSFNRISAYGKSSIGGFIGISTAEVVIDGSCTASDALLVNDGAVLNNNSLYATGGLIGSVRGKVTVGTVDSDEIAITLSGITTTVDNCSDWRYATAGVIGNVKGTAPVVVSSVAVTNSLICGATMTSLPSRDSATFLSSILGTNSSNTYGNAGGIVGSVGRDGNTGAAAANVTVTNCRVDSSDIISYNSAGGLVGDVRHGTLTIENCTVGTATDSSVRIATHGRAGGAIGYWGTSEASHSISVSLRGVRVGNDQTATIIEASGATDLSMAGGLLGGNVEGTAMRAGANVSVTAFEDANGNKIGNSVTNCHIYGLLHAGGTIAKSYRSQVITLHDLDLVGNTVVTTSGNSAGGIIGSDDDAASQIYLNNITISDSKIATRGGSVYTGGISRSISGRLYGSNILWSNNTLGSTSVSLVNLQNNAVPVTVTADTRYAVWISTVGSSADVTLSAISRQGKNAEYTEIGGTTANATLVYADYAGTKGSDGTAATQGADIPISPERNAVAGSAWYGDGVADDMPRRIYNERTDSSILDRYSNAAVSSFTTLDDTYLNTISSYFPTAAEGTLPILYVRGDINSLITEYINLLTNGGFSAYTTRRPSDVAVSVSSYFATADAITATARAGSVAYAGGEFTSAQSYDSVEENGLSFSLITVSFTNNKSTTDTEVFTTSFAVYYPQILQLSSYISLKDHESYNISGFLNRDSQVNIGDGDVFAAYFEYVYNEVRLEDNWNYPKNIRITDAGGSLPAGTKITLVDLNSADSNGYRAYYHTLTQNSATINLSDMVGSDGSAFSPIELSALPQYRNENSLASITNANSSGYGAERYIAIFELPLLDNPSNQSYIYTLRPGVDDDIGEQYNVELHYDTAENAPITAWNKPTISSALGAINSATIIQRSAPVEAEHSVDITFSQAYIDTFSRSGGTRYGVTRLYMTDNENNRVVLPAGTIVTVGGKSYTMDGISSYLELVIDDDDGQPLNILQATEQNRYALSQSVSIDFSNISAQIMEQTFPSGRSYSLISDFYLTSNADYPTIGQLVSSQLSLTENLSRTAALTVNVDGNSLLHLGVNPLDVNDETNDGVIDYHININLALCSAAEIESITTNDIQLSYRLYKKNASNEYAEVAMENYLDPVPTTVTLNAADYDAQNMQYTSKYTLRLKSPASTATADFANYKLEVTANLTGVPGLTLTDHFIYTLAKIPSEFVD